MMIKCRPALAQSGVCGRPCPPPPQNDDNTNTNTNTTLTRPPHLLKHRHMRPQTRLGHRDPLPHALLLPFHQ